MSEDLYRKAQELRLYGLIARWSELTAEELDFVARFLDWEEFERKRRSLERRVQDARLGRYKPIADFDWAWPSKIDPAAIQELMGLEFIRERANVVMAGPNGVGKTMIVKNIAYAALLQGHTVRFTTASGMLNDLAAQDGATALHRRLNHYCRPQLLVVDEVGYLSYNARHADLLFEVVTRRYDQRSIVVTTNKPFGDWGEVFPNASCVVTLVDRLVHRCELLTIEGASFRLKESKERRAQKAAGRAKR